MATGKGIHIFENYVVHHKFYTFIIYVCTLYSKKLKGRTEWYFILFLKLNDYPTRCFDFGLRRIHPNGSMFELNFYKFKSKTKPF